VQVERASVLWQGVVKALRLVGQLVRSVVQWLVTRSSGTVGMVTITSNENR
jgi:hypothetical protein